MTLKYCKCGAVVGDSYQISEFIRFEKWTCTCQKDYEEKIKIKNQLLNEKKMKQKIKIKILKFLITDNNFYDRERLMQLSERPLLSVIYCGIYRKFLKLFVEKKS